jgi:hypothetical protein
VLYKDKTGCDGGSADERLISGDFKVVDGEVAGERLISRDFKAVDGEVAGERLISRSNEDADVEINGEVEITAGLSTIIGDKDDDVDEHEGINDDID